MNKPRKVSWLCYYIATPLRSILHKVRGDWYCEYCQAYHGRRTYKYPLLFLAGKVSVHTKSTLKPAECRDRCVCSQGKKALLTGQWLPEHSRLATHRQVPLHHLHTEPFIKEV